MAAPLRFMGRARGALLGGAETRPGRSESGAANWGLLVRANGKYVRGARERNGVADGVAGIVFGVAQAGAAADGAAAVEPPPQCCTVAAALWPPAWLLATATEAAEAWALLLPCCPLPDALTTGGPKGCARAVCGWLVLASRLG